MTEKVKVFEVKRDQLSETRFVEEALTEPGAGQAILRISSFAITSNNVTYGVVGERMNYWKFFPSTGGEEQNWGRIPVWGFAEILDTQVEGLREGDRFYGCYPMASHVVVRPDSVTNLGFVDAIHHRKDLPPFYSEYRRTDTDPSYSDHNEGLQMLYRPLFLTSFLIRELLTENSFFGASRVLVSSASSKTSMCLAWLLKNQQVQDIEVVGLTSSRNLDYVKTNGVFDGVIAYEDIESLDGTLSVFVDMAGNAKVRSDLHGHLQNSLKYSCAVGAAHWNAARFSGNGELPGPKPTLFFAPAERDNLRSVLGQAVLEGRIADVWERFASQVGDWIWVRQDRDEAAIRKNYLDMVNNKISPDTGLIASL